ncbi:MAG: V-type ATP synthase subunit E [Sphaerochaeta sp.]
MAQQIQELVATIRKDGIEAAQKEADQIISDAKAEAAQLVEKARKEAAREIENAKKEIATRDQSAISSLQQASRDVQLSLKKSIQDELDRILASDIEKVYASKELAGVIIQVVSSLSDIGTKELQLNQKDFDQLAASLKKELGQEIKKGLEIKAVPSARSGFKVTEKDGSAFYDFSAEETAELLRPFLSPSIQKIVFQAEH